MKALSSVRSLALAIRQRSPILRISPGRSLIAAIAAFVTRARSQLLADFVSDVALAEQLSKMPKRSSCFVTDQLAARLPCGIATASLNVVLNRARSMLALLRSNGITKLFAPWAIGGNPKLSAVALTRSSGKQAVAMPKPACVTRSISAPDVG